MLRVFLSQSLLVKHYMNKLSKKNWYRDERDWWATFHHIMNKQWLLDSELNLYFRKPIDEEKINYLERIVNSYLLRDILEFQGVKKADKINSLQINLKIKLILFYKNGMLIEMIKPVKD